MNYSKQTLPFGGEKTQNKIPKSHRCYSWDRYDNINACGSKNVYVRNIKEFKSKLNITLIGYEVVCYECGNVQKLVIKKYKLNNFLKVQ